MRIATAALVLVSISVLAVPTSAVASTPGHGETRCKNDGHKYIEGKTATLHGKKVTFVGAFARFHPCGEDDGYFTGGTKTITLTLTSATKITVYAPKSKTGRRNVTAAQFPHAFKKNIDESHYQYTGPKSDIKVLKLHFVS